MIKSLKFPVSFWQKCGHAVAMMCGGVAVGVVCLAGAGVRATVLDDFNGVKAGWTDTLNSGTVAQGSGVFVISTATNNGSLTYSTKTANGLTNVQGHTLELRVDVNTVTPGNGNVNPLAVLAWVPSGGAVLGSGYSLVVGAGVVRIQKGASVLYTQDYGAAGTNIQNTNITMVLRMTPSGGAVELNARVYKLTGTQAQANYTVLFERTVTDGAGLVNGGHAALGLVNQASATGATVVYDNLQAFDLINTVLDNFAVADNLSGWTTFMKHPGAPDAVTESMGQVECIAGQDSSGGFAGAFYSAKTFKVVNGGRVEFSVDFDNMNGPGSYSVLGYLPGGGLPAVYTLSEYHIAHNINNSSYLVVGKNYNGWWATGPNNLPVNNCRYTLTMSGEGNNCRIEARLEDLSVGVNEPNRVAFQNVFVDTPATDYPGDGATLTPLPYLNADGNFVISAFNAGTPANAYVVFRNARVSQTVPQNSAPIIANMTPRDGSNFVSSASSVTFNLLDDVNTPVDRIALTLNGVTYTDTSPGVTVTGNNQNRLFTLANSLAPNVNYVGTISATDNEGASTVLLLRFDTFLTSNYTVESEEYNFSQDEGLTGGAYIDNPLLLSELMLDNNAYNSQPGLPEVDFHDNRGTTFKGNGGTYDAEHTFRTYDHVRTSHSPDLLRAKYAAAGGPSQFVFENDIIDIHDGDWVNYTHTYPAGAYNIYIRQAQYRLSQSLVTLERVGGDRTSTNQTTSVLGSFVGSAGGMGLYYNVPLADAMGVPVAVKFSGVVDTIRVRNRITGNADDEVGLLTQNYLVLVPIPDPGTLRPVVTLATPLRNSTVQSVSPVITASIANRDTAIASGSVELYVNGRRATGVTVAESAAGAEVSYALSPLPPANAPVVSTIIYRDSQGVSVTNTWSWTLTYPYLRASSSLPVGSLSLRGFEVRTVQAYNGGANLDNSLERAEQQLAIPPQIPYDVTATSMVQVLDWNQSGTPNNVPGLCSGDINNIASEVFAYLELTAGVHRFHIVTDDRAGLYSGANLRDRAVVMFEAAGDTANATFDFVVEADGLYPIRLVWEETGGGAALALRSVNLANNSETLINDPANPAGVVKAWYPLGVVSSASVTGPYAVDPAAVNTTTTSDVICGDTGQPVNQMLTGGTFTLPLPAATKFYRIDSPRPTRITEVSRTGASLVIKYQVQ